MIRKLVIGFSVLLAILAIAFLTGRWVLVGYLTPDFLVSQIERQWNCRAHIDDVHVTLLGSAAVEIRGLALAERDDFAGRPLGERPPIDPARAQLTGESVRLEIRPMELIRRELNIRQLTLSGLAVETGIDSEGNAAIRSLFEPAARNAAPLAEPVVKTDAAEPEKEPFSMVADRFDIQNARADFQIEASGNTVRLEGFEIAFSEIDVDPKALATHNRARFQFHGDLSVVPAADQQAEAKEYFRGKISGGGEVTPFRAETGLLDPVWTSDLTLHQGAQLETFPVIARLRELLQGVDTAGIDLNGLQVRGTLLADAQTRIGHAGGKYIFKSPLTIALPDTTLTVEEKSWIHTGTSRHRIEGRVVASEDLTKKITTTAGEYLAKKSNGLVAGNLSGLILGPLMEEGRLSIGFSSDGDLSQPKMDIRTPLGDLSDVIGKGKDAGKAVEEVGKNLLKNLFGN